MRVLYNQYESRKGEFISMDMENKEQESEKTEENSYEDVCFVCHRPESKTGKMIHLTKEISICPECMQRTMDMMSSGNVD